MRIDGALTPPGFIAAGKMHTLVFKNDTLYVLYSGPGPASRADWSKVSEGKRVHRGKLENMAVSALLKKYLKRITAYEEQIDDENLEQLVKEKHCCKLPKAQISDLKLKRSPADIRLMFKGAGRKFKFDCGLEDVRNVERLMELLEN